MNMQSNKLNEAYVIWGKRLIWVGIITYAIIMVSLVHDNLFSLNLSEDWSEVIDWDLMSKIGGLIGGVITPIWTLIGGLFLYQTLMLQQEATKVQNKIIKAQQFENTLMNMLQRQERIKNEIDFNLLNTFVWYRIDAKKIKNSKISGELFFRNSKETFKIWYEEHNWRNTRDDFFYNSNITEMEKQRFIQEVPEWDAYLKDWLERIVFKGDIFYGYYQVYFDYYFRHLESVFQLIEKGNEDEIFRVEDDHHPYIKFFKAQLSASELFHIYYGSHSRYASIRSYIEKYDFLENLSEQDLVVPEKHKIFRPKEKKTKKRSHA